MKKVTVLCLESDRDASLNSLQELGVLHVTHVQTPESADLDASRAELDNAKAALTVIEDYEEDLNESSKPKHLTEATSEAIDHIHELAHQKNRLLEEHSSLEREKAAIKPLGDFDPELVKKLAEKNINVRFYTASSKTNIIAPEHTQLVQLSKDSSGQYFAIIGKEDFEFNEQEVTLPNTSLSEIEKKLKETNKKLETTENELKKLAIAKESIEETITTLEENTFFIEAKDGMGSSGKIAYMQGFCPTDLTEQLQGKSAEQGWGLVIEEPGDDDVAPTLIKNPAWIHPIKAVFDMIDILPGYKEIDISAVFLIFFSIFFAILVGDAGYGIIFLIATILAKLKFKKAPSYPFTLLGILSVCTIIWGVITGNFFGVTTSLPTPLKGFTIEWLLPEANIMTLCFLLGAIHLTIAHLWNAIRMMNSLKALAQIGWIALSWTMFLAARTMILNAEFYSFGYYLLIGGIILVSLFMTSLKEFKTEWPNHVMLPLSVISNFVDVVSYVRLFAVGSASLAVAAAFNDMALEKGFGSVGSGLGAALIMFGGHTLNIVLAAMGILVHGVRLNTLEFSGHIGMEWTGVHYDPFSKKLKNKAK